MERWCRLRGNLLFYFKSRDHWSEPAGVFVLDCDVSTEDSNVMDSIFGFHLSFGSGLCQYLGCHTPEEREAWRAALQRVSHSSMRQQLDSLRAAVTRLDRADTGRGVGDTGARAWVWPHVPALLEAGLACDNLPCDGLGRPPSPRVLVYLRNSADAEWRPYASTEIVEVTIIFIIASLLQG